MTFCVAGICEHEGKPAIVCISDHQSTLGDFVKTSDSYKYRYEGNSTILMSGTVGKTDELLSMLTPIFVEFDQKEKPEEDFDLRISDILEQIRVVVRKRKRQLINHYLGMRHGITHEEFLKNGNDWFSPHIYATIQAEIRAVKLDSDIIYTYAHDSEAIIIEITDDGQVIWQEHYACIGSGSTIGLAILAQNPWDDYMSVMDCSARLCLAKWSAEKDPYVSEEGSLDISVQKSRTMDDLSEKGYEYLYSKIERIAAPTGLENNPEYFTLTHSNDTAAETTEAAPPTAEAANDSGVEQAS